MNQTHTYAVLEVSKATFDEIAEKLSKAGYHHVFHSESHGADREQKDVVIDMHGIGLKQEDHVPETRTTTAGH